MNGTAADLGAVDGDRDGRRNARRGRCRSVPSGDADQPRGRTRAAASRSAGRTSMPRPAGAHTGCISAAMLLDAGATLTIVGHSERRQDQHESDADVRAKAEAALAAGLARDPVRRRKRRGARRAATRSRTSAPSSSLAARSAVGPVAPVDRLRADLGDRHRQGRRRRRHRAKCTPRCAQRLVAAYGEAGQAMRILYGGSVKASNAAEIFAVARRRRRTGRRREPQGGRFRADHRAAA